MRKRSGSTSTRKAARRPGSRGRVVITIDGPAGVGKSTTAKLLAQRLGLVYLDTGATYRALAHEALARGIDPRKARAVARCIPSLKLILERSANGSLRVLLNGQDVTRAIRAERVTEAAAIIAQHAPVRAGLVRMQRRLARGHSIVVEGRDTGSVVFPAATFKFFLTAHAWIRARRRREELIALHGQAPTLEELTKQLTRRDRLDRTRAVGPLIRPRGAILVDTSNLDAAKVVHRMLLRIDLAPRSLSGSQTLSSTVNGA